MKFHPYFYQGVRARIKGKPSIFLAVENCDFELVWDHLASDAFCVNYRRAQNRIGVECVRAAPTNLAWILPFYVHYYFYEPNLLMRFSFFAIIFRQETPLHHAAHCNAELCRLLLQNKADLDAKAVG